MKHQITDKLERISFHDYSVESIDYSSGMVAIKFDWAYIEDFTEANIQEGIIIGNCNLVLSLAGEDEFYVYVSEGFSQRIERPEGFEKYYSLIGTTDLVIEGNVMKFCLGGFYESEKEYRFIVWKIPFINGRLSWDSHVLENEWKNGAPPEK